MKKLLIALTSLALFAGCANNTAPVATTTPEATPEATQEAAATPEATTAPEINTGLKILAPNGAPGLAVIPAVKEGYDVNFVAGSDPLQAAFVAPESEYDVIVAPTNLGVKLNTVGNSSYKLLAVVTWGNLYVVGTSEEQLSDTNAKIGAFGEAAVPGLVFKKVYPDINAMWFNAVTDAQQNLLSGNVDAALLAEPAATATIAKAKENNKEFKIIGNLQAEWGEGGYPQAALFVKEDAYAADPASYDALVTLMADYTSAVKADDTAALEADIDEIGAETLGVPNSKIVGKTWPRMNIRVVKGSEVVNAIEEFCGIFNIQNSADAVLK